MGSDYKGAEWLPCKNFWAGGNTRKFVVVHGTASGGPQTGRQLATSTEFNDGSSASVHYINDVDGWIGQVVNEKDAAWGNCCVTGNGAPAGYLPLPQAGAYHDTFLTVGHNYNWDTISIENVKHSTDNSEALTTAQYNALVLLVRDICVRNNIPLRKATGPEGGIIGHFDLDPVNRARCPGNFDWNRFIKDVQAGTELPIQLVAMLAQVAGFQNESLATAIAISHAESNFRPMAQDINPDGKVDRGIVQINTYWQASTTDAQAYDPAQAFAAMFRISSGGTNFNAWNTYKSGAYLNYIPTQGDLMSPTTPSGEIISVNEANQFQPNHTQDACGFFACAIVRSGSKPGMPPQRSVQQIIDNGEAWYAQFDGDNGPGNTDGMSVPQLYALIRQMTYDYRTIDLGKNPLAYITAWVNQGYPVIIAFGESTAYDFALGGSPYYWNTTPFNHIITVTGIASDGHFLVRDTANVTDLNDPNSLRPGPRKYDKNRLSLVSATAVMMPWLPVPPAGFDPTKGSIEMLPKGWTDDGTLLHNPKNKFVVASGFRKHIVNDPVVWQGGVPLENEDDSMLVQLEESNPAVGLGHRQTFEVSALGWQASSGNVYEQYVGQELLFVRNDRNAKAAALAKSASDLQSAQAQVVALQAALATCQASGGLTPEMQAAINQAVAAQPQVDAVLNAFKPFVK